MFRLDCHMFSQIPNQADYSHKFFASFLIVLWPLVYTTLSLCMFQHNSQLLRRSWTENVQSRYIIHKSGRGTTWGGRGDTIPVPATGQAMLGYQHGNPEWSFLETSQANRRWLYKGIVRIFAFSLYIKRVWKVRSWAAKLFEG